MLPDNLASSYDKYKKDTNAFCSWLHTTAASCGYNTPFVSVIDDEDEHLYAHVVKPEPVGRLKGKARKEAKAKSNPEPKITIEPKRIVSTKQLLKQANAVATSKKIKVPIHIQKLLHQAIKARKRCTKWFANTLGQDSKEDKSTETHEHFIKVLEKTFEILTPCFEVPKQRQARIVTVVNEEEEGAADDLSNRFGYLEVEDTDDKVYDALPSVAPKTQHQTANVEFEEDADADLPFIVFCFYEDMHELRTFLRQTWLDVHEARLSYMTASLVTNIAMELVEKTEKAIVEGFPSLGEASYLAITSKIYPVQTIPDAEANAPEEALAMLERAHEAMEKSKNGDSNAFDSLKEEMENVGRLREKQSTSMDEASSLKDAFLFTSIFLILEKCRRMLAVNLKTHLPAVVALEPMLMWSPELVPQTPMWEVEDSILSEFILEIVIKLSSRFPTEQIDKARKAGWLEPISKTNIRVSPVMDRFTELFEDYCLNRSKAVSISQTFAARLFVDILFTMGEKVGGVHKGLLQKCANAEAALGISGSGDRSILNGLVPTPEELKEKWIRPDAIAAAITLSHTIDAVIKKPTLVWFKQNIMGESLKKKKQYGREEMLAFMKAFGVESDKILPSDNPKFYYEVLPVYSGVEALRTTIALNKIGIELANDFYSFMATAHLYNALQQQGLLQGRWKAMDRAIEVNLSKLFKGSRAGNPDACLKKLFLCIGMSSHNFAPKRRQLLPGFHALFKKSESLFEVSPFSASLQRYFDGEVESEKLLFDVLKQEQHGRSICASPPSRIELLAQLRSSLEGNIPSLEIDMIRLVRQCNILLRSIREEFKSKLNIENSKDGQEYGYFFPQRNVVTVMEILDDMKAAEDLKSRRRGKCRTFAVGDDEDTTVSLATRCLQDFMQTADIIAKVEPFDVIAETDLTSSSEELLDEKLKKVSDRETKKWLKAIRMKFKD